MRRGVVLLGVVVACGSGSGAPAPAPAPPPDAGDVPAPPVAEAGAEASAPAPEIVAKDLGTLWEIACDGSAAYVAAEGAEGKSTIYRVAPGATAAPIAIDQYRGRYVAVAGGRVYWVAGGSGGWSYVRATEKTNDGGVPPVDYFKDGNGNHSFSLLSIGKSQLAFSIFYDTSGAGKILRGGLDGGATALVAEYTALPITDVALGEDLGYWLEPMGAIRREDVGTALFDSGATSIAVSNGEVLFTSDDGQLRSVPVGGGAPRLVATGLRLARHLVADGKDAVWVDTETGAIATVTIAGGTPRTIAAASANTTIAVCDRVLWFTNPARRTVERITRP